MRLLCVTLRLLAWGSLGLYPLGEALGVPHAIVAISVAALFGIASAVVDYERR
jgi:hypothetical protein